MKLLTVFSLVFLIQTSLISQVNQEWVARFSNLPNGIYNVAGVSVDNSGNVFIAGSMSGTTLTDYVTIKYNSSGVQQWAKIFTGLIEDRIIDMALDHSGNICVTGLSENQTGTYDIITIKYNTDGDSLWVKRYNGANAFTMDQPVAMVTDNNDNVYVTGYSFGSSPMNYVTIKYSPAGDSLWVARYPSGGTDVPRDIFVDASGIVYVYGRGTTILKYDQNGSLIWDKEYPVDAAETNRMLYADNGGNIYFGATKFTSTFKDFALTKTNSSGDTLWTRSYNGLGNSQTNHDDPAAISVDNNGNVFMTGKCYNLSAFFFSTIKYNAAGEFQWERNYSSPQNGEGGNDIITDNSGNIYVTGGSEDFVTIKYNTAGDSLWKAIYNGPANMMDIAEAIIMDNSGNVYVTGRSRIPGQQTYYEFATVKYSQTLTGISSATNLAKSFQLYQNFPNPFNPKTIIKYDIGNTDLTSLKIFDISGKCISTLVNEMQSAGNYSIDWDGSDYSSGIYFYELRTGKYSEVKRMMLLK